MTRILEHACLLVLLVIVGLRPLISERYDSSVMEMTRALQGVEDASPLPTLLMDAAVLLVAAVWLATRALGRDRRYRWCGLEWGALVTAAAAAVSCVFASNRRLAINGAVDWLCCVLLAILLVQLLRSRRHIQLAVTVILASAGAQAIECFNQVSYSFPETEAAYREQREDLWARQGVALDSQRVELFEARLRSRETFGYLSHSNIAGAHLVLCGLVAAGLGWARWRESVTAAARGTAGAAFVASGVILGAAVTTRSLGAMIGGGAALGLFMVRVGLDGVWRQHPSALFRCGWTAFVVACFAVVGHGLYHGSLPGRSLDFRWKYWVGAANVVADHPLTGVGSGNFGRHYLRYKTVDSPEEVTSPHSFLVSAATDWGVVGCGGLLLMLFGGSRVVCRPAPHQPPDSLGDNEATAGSKLWHGILVAGGIFALRVPLLGTDDPNHLYFETMLPFLAWASVYAILMVGSAGRLDALATATGFAVLAFLIQDTINFASLVPGTLVTVTACFAVVVASRAVASGESSDERLRTPSGMLSAAVLATVGLVLWVIVPVWSAEGALRRARHAASLDAALVAYRDATRADRLDPTPFLEAGRLLRSEAERNRSPATIDRAINWLYAAALRDPGDTKAWRELSRCHALRAEWTGDADDFTRAVTYARRVLERYPVSPANEELLADRLEARGVATGNRDDLLNAVGSYERALDIDDHRPDREVIRRLRPDQRRRLRDKIEQAKTTIRRIPDES